jgi:hypothetical protein
MKRLFLLIPILLSCSITFDYLDLSVQQKNYVGAWLPYGSRDDVFYLGFVFSNDFFSIKTSSLSDYNSNNIDYLFGKIEYKTDSIELVLHGYSTKEKNIVMLENTITISNTKRREIIALHDPDNRETKETLLPVLYHKNQGFYADLQIRAKSFDGIFSKQIEAFQSYENTPYADNKYYDLEQSFSELIGDESALLSVLYP